MYSKLSRPTTPIFTSYYIFARKGPPCYDLLFMSLGRVSRFGQQSTKTLGTWIGKSFHHSCNFSMAATI